MADVEALLAKRIALDLGIHNSELVLEAVRRHHGGIYSRNDELTTDEYEALRDVVEGDLLGWEGPSLFE
jgi:hypothetical protein